MVSYGARVFTRRIIKIRLACYRREPSWRSQKGAPMKHSLITLVAFAALAGCSSKEDPQSPTQNRSSTIRNPRGGRISFVCPMPIRSVPADGNSAPPELSGKPLTLTLTRPTTEPVNKGPQTLTLIAPGGYRKGPVTRRYCSDHRSGDERCLARDDPGLLRVEHADDVLHVQHEPLSARGGPVGGTHALRYLDCNLLVCRLFPVWNRFPGPRKYASPAAQPCKCRGPPSFCRRISTKR